MDYTQLRSIVFLSFTAQLFSTRVTFTRVDELPAGIGFPAILPELRYLLQHRPISLESRQIPRSPPHNNLLFLHIHCLI
jgi:hypothetical protein